MENEPNKRRLLKMMHSLFIFSNSSITIPQHYFTKKMIETYNEKKAQDPMFGEYEHPATIQENKGIEEKLKRAHELQLDHLAHELGAKKK